MANKIREKIGSMEKRIQARLEKTFETTLEKTLQTAMNSPLTAKAATAVELAQAKVEKARKTAKGAKATAKQSLDQVLLGLQHKGLDVKQPKDLVYAVGRKVLERAEAVREQVATNSMAPTWLKDINLNNLMPVAAATEFGADSASASKGTTEAAAPKTSAGTKVGATEGDAKLAEAAASGDGEAEEALEASASERSAGFVAEGAKVTPSATASSKASNGNGKSGVSPIAEAVANTGAAIKKAKAKKSKSGARETTH